jgi:hypothetical protein
MPLPTDEFIAAIKANDSAQAKEIFDDHPEVMFERTGQIPVLNYVIEKGSDDLLLHMIGHEQFQWTNPNFEHNHWKVFLETPRPNVIVPLLSQPEVLEQNGVLAYSVVEQKKKWYETMIAKQKASSPTKQMLEGKLEKCTAILSAVRDATILHAIANDDGALMEHLKAVGANPLWRLGEYGKNQRPIDLITKDKVNIRAWIVASDKKDAADFAQRKEASLENARKGAELERQRSQVEAKFFGKTAASTAKALDKTLEATRTVGKSPRS